MSFWECRTIFENNNGFLPETILPIIDLFCAKRLTDAKKRKLNIFNCFTYIFWDYLFLILDKNISLTKNALSEN